MTKPLLVPPQMHEIPSTAASVHALDCLRALAHALETTGAIFAGTFHSQTERKHYEAVLNVVFDPSGYRILTHLGHEDGAQPAELAASAHETLARVGVLAPLHGSAQALHRALMAFPVLSHQPVGEANAQALALSFHMHGSEHRFFRMDMLNSFEPRDVQTPTVDTLVSVEGWRFHLLANAPAWPEGYAVARWHLDGGDVEVFAPNPALARVLLAVSCPGEQLAFRILFDHTGLVLWRTVNEPGALDTLVGCLTQSTP